MTFLAKMLDTFIARAWALVRVSLLLIKNKHAVIPESNQTFSYFALIHITIRS